METAEVSGLLFAAGLGILTGIAVRTVVELYSGDSFGSVVERCRPAVLATGVLLVFTSTVLDRVIQEGVECWKTWCW